MATYPIKVLKDETGVPFVPLVSSTGITSPDGTTLEDNLTAKLEVTNIIAGDNIILEKDGNNITITGTASGAANVVINNLETTEPKQGVLDAHQGYVLNNKITQMAETLEGGIPQVINNCTTIDTINALSAYQGYLLDNKFNNYLPLSGGNLTGSLSIEGELNITNSPGINLYPQARGALTEGMRIFNASNGYSLLYCGSESLSDGIVMVSGPDGLRYLDAYVGGDVHRSHLPHKDGTLAHTSDIVYGAVRDGDGNTISSTYLKSGGSGSLNSLGVTTLTTNTAYINPIFTNNHDTRNSNPTPQETLGTPGIRVDFKANSTDGLWNGGAYHGVISYRSYGSAADWTGGPMHQIGMGECGLSWRVGATTWSSWKNIPTSYVQSSTPSGNLKVGDVWFIT